MENDFIPTLNGAIALYSIDALIFVVIIIYVLKKFIRNNRPHKKGLWARLYDKELH